MTTRVTDFSQNALVQFQLQQVQGQIAAVQAQVGSGKVAQTFDGLGVQSQQLISLENQHTKITQYVANIDLANQRIQATQTSVTSILNMAVNLQTALVNALNPGNANSMAITQSAQTQLQQLAGQLNTQFQGQYLFGGSVTNTPPVNLSAAGFTTPPSVYPSSPNTAYYQGNSSQLAVQADDNLSVGYGAMANQPAFEELVRAFKLVATAAIGPSTSDTPRLQEALRVTKLAISDITNVQSQLGVVQNVIGDVKNTHNQLLLLTDQSIGDITNVDTSKAATDLSAYQLTLQSSFAVTARLSQLSLANFLR